MTAAASRHRPSSRAVASAPFPSVQHQAWSDSRNRCRRPLVQRDAWHDVELAAVRRACSKLNQTAARAPAAEPSTQGGSRSGGSKAAQRKRYWIIRDGASQLRKNTASLTPTIHELPMDAHARDAMKVGIGRAVLFKVAKMCGISVSWYTSVVEKHN